MKRMRLLALIAAVITALFVYFYLNSLKQPETVIEYTNVVVAADDIPANTVITADMVSLTQIPAETLNASAITDPAYVVGKVLNSQVYTGEQISVSRLVSADGDNVDSSLEYMIEPGMRAITIEVDEVSGLTGMLNPGNRVDILYQIDVETEIQDPDGTVETKSIPYSVYLLQNVKILAVDSITSTAGKGIDTETGLAVSYTSLTLEVTPEQAQKTSFSEYTGDLRAILRSPLDEDSNNLPNITLDDFID